MKQKYEIPQRKAKIVDQHGQLVDEKEETT